MQLEYIHDLHNSLIEAYKHIDDMDNNISELKNRLDGLE